MRSLLFAAVATLLPIHTPHPPVATPPGPITGDERAMLASNLQVAQLRFLTATIGLSETQWRFKPAPDRWSIAEVAEHIALVERSIGQLVQGPLLQSPETEPAADRAAVEARARAIMADRSFKAKAPEGFVPTGTWATTAALLGAQVANHAALLEYVRITDAPLRWHRSPHPLLGQMDGVQWLVFLAAHTGRHVQQIEEVKRVPGYPM